MLHVLSPRLKQAGVCLHQERQTKFGNADKGEHQNPSRFCFFLGSRRPKHSNSLSSAGPYAGLASHHQDEEDGQVNQAHEEERSRGFSLALFGRLGVQSADRLQSCPGVAPELDAGPSHDGVGHTAEPEEGPACEAGPREDGADGEEEEGVSQGDAGVEGRVGDRHHVVASLGIVVSQRVRQTVEVGELPSEHERDETPSAGRAHGKVERVGASCPAHQRRYRTDQRAEPRIHDADAFERRVHAGIEQDVGQPQTCGEGVDKVIEESNAERARCEAEACCMQRSDGTSDENSVPCAVHLGI